jgi:hypothetical protein
MPAMPLARKSRRVLCSDLFEPFFFKISSLRYGILLQRVESDGNFA